MATKGKFYMIDPTVYSAKSADIAKLPKQQQQILRTMANHCVDTGMRGSEIVALAVTELGLETRQDYKVLYAWYARSNEAYGVYTGTEKPVTYKTESDLINEGTYVE